MCWIKSYQRYTNTGLNNNNMLYRLRNDNQQYDHVYYSSK